MKWLKVRKQKIFIFIILSLIIGFLQINLQCSKIISTKNNRIEEQPPDSKIENEISIISSRTNVEITPILFQYNFLLPFFPEEIVENPTIEEELSHFIKIFDWASLILNELNLQLTNLGKDKNNIYLSGIFLDICNGDLEIFFDQFIKDNPSLSSLNSLGISKIQNMKLASRCTLELQNILRFNGSLGVLYSGEIFDSSLPFIWKKPISVETTEDENLYLESFEKIKFGHERLIRKILGRDVQENERYLYLNPAYGLKPNIALNSPKNEYSWLRQVIEGLGFDYVVGNISKEFYRLFNHYIFNPFRPKLDEIIFQQNMDTKFILNHSIPFVGKVDISFGIEHDLRLGFVKKQFLIAYINWREQSKKANKKIFTFGVDVDLNLFLENPTLRVEYQSFNTWINDQFIQKILPGGRGEVIKSSNKLLIEYFINKEVVNSWSQFNYPYHQKMDFAFPYDFILNEQLIDDEFVNFIDNSVVPRGFVFKNNSPDGGGKSFALIFPGKIDDNIDENYLRQSISAQMNSVLKIKTKTGEILIFDDELLFDEKQEYLIIYEVE